MKTKLLLLSILVAQMASAQFDPTPIYPYNNASGYLYGLDLDIFGEEIVIASKNSQPTSNLGKVYLFSTGGTLLQTFESDIPNNFDGFGHSVCISDNFLAIGAWLGANQRGSVKIYTKIGGQWQFFQQITAPDGNFLDAFSTVIEINGNTMFVTADGDELDGQDVSTNSSSVYIFTFDGTQWNFTQKLQPEGFFQYGRKIESKNDKTVIYSNVGNNNGPFAFHLLTKVNNVWQFESTSPAIGNAEEIVNDFSLDNDQIYFVTVREGESEKIEIADYSNGQWNFIPQLFVTPFDDQNFTRLLVNGDKMFVGSSNYVLPNTRKFPLLFYKKVNNDWVYQPVTYSDATESIDDYFGENMAISGNNLLIGAFRDYSISAMGNAYLIDTTLGVQNFLPATTLAYPNPTNDKIHFENTTVSNAKIYSITGSLLLEVAGPINELSLQNLSNGMYLIKADTDEGQSQTFKIIKN